MQRVVIMGLGYIGLPTAALIADSNMQVLGVDVNQSVVDTINEGKIHIIEPDLDALVYKVVSEGRLKASLQPQEADVFLIAVPTPFRDNYNPDLSYVEKAIDMISDYVKEGNLIIIESTSPVGTTEMMYERLMQKRPDIEGKIYMAYCPERVLPGQVLYELVHNDRVIGGINENSAQKAISFYSHFAKGSLFKTNSKTAEMCKLVENSFRDVNIAFANELSMLCDKFGIDVWELRELANKHPRVNILYPGVGVGGHCIAVDPWFIISALPDDTKIIKAAREVNHYKTDWVIKKIKDTIGEFEKNNNTSPKVACMGITYKPDIDDIRESPALYIVSSLVNEGIDVIVAEPNINSFEGLKLMDYKVAINEADIIVILVPHSEFKAIQFRDLNKIVLDFVGLVR